MVPGAKPLNNNGTVALQLQDAQGSCHPYSMSRLSVSAAIVRAVEENFWSQWSQFGRAPGGMLHEDAGATWFETPIPVPPYNAVIRATRCDARLLSRVFGHFEARGVPFLWIRHPSSPPELIQALNARGFVDVEPIHGMAMDLSELSPEPALPAGVTIEPVTHDHAFAPFLEFVAYRWHVPPEEQEHLRAIVDYARLGLPGSPNTAYIAVRDGLALSKVTLHREGGVVGVYGVATRPEASGQGLARLLCSHALHRARDAGGRIAVLHSTPMAHKLYGSLGFQDAGHFAVFAKDGSFHA